MGYVGYKPASVPLTSADITDGIITSAKIADGTIVGADINSTFDLTGKTVTGAGATQETGTWTPTITITDGGTYNSASNLQCNYVKIGKLVYISVETGALSTGGSPAVYASYSFTLPFTCEKVSTGEALEYGQTGLGHTARADEGGTVVLLRRNDAGNFVANAYLRFGFTYKSTT